MDFQNLSFFNGEGGGEEEGLDFDFDFDLGGMDRKYFAFLHFNNACEFGMPSNTLAMYPSCFSDSR